MPRIVRSRHVSGRAPRLAARLGSALQAIGAALAIAALCAMAVGSKLVGAQHRLDPRTLCPIDAPVTAHVAVMLDRTDPWDREAMLLAARVIAGLKAELPVHGRLTAHLVGGDPDDAAQAALDLCNPGDGTTVDRLTGNPRRAQRRFEAGFATPIADLIAGLAVAERADRSPLVEALAAVAMTMEPSPRRRIVIVSDLLQNSAAQSHYRGAPDVAAMLAAPVGARLADGRLDGVGVTLVRLPNDVHASRQNAALTAFWIELVRAVGGSAAFQPERQEKRP
jgi:hypothetical protein